MNKELSSVPNLDIVDGQILTTSMRVAEFYGRRHRDVVRKIEQLDIPADFFCANFFAQKHSHPKTGEIYSSYQMTKDGFYFLVSGFTGKKAYEFRIAFIREFNRMEKEIKRKSDFDPYITELLGNLASHCQKQDMRMVRRSEYEALKTSYGNLVELFQSMQDRLDDEIQCFEAIVERIEKADPKPEGNLIVIK